LKYSTYLFLPENILEKNPLSLSGGERRKLIFLLSLLKENKYILIENLLLHLDIESINKIIELIGIVSQNNIKLLYTLPNTKLLSHWILTFQFKSILIYGIKKFMIII